MEAPLSPVSSITPIAPNRYKVGILQPGSLMHIECEVGEDRGVPYMVPTPDVFMASTIDVRAVAKAVIDYHENRQGERDE